VEICCDPERILRKPDYRERYEAFTPPEDLVAALRAISEPTTVLVVWGYWCQDSARIVPALLKALATADSGNLRLLAVHVAYAETDPSPFMAGPVAVRRYPTIAFLRGHYEQVAEIAPGSEWALFVEQMPTAAGLRAQ
jgi:hypothetical protein